MYMYGILVHFIDIQYMLTCSCMCYQFTEFVPAVCLGLYWKVDKCQCIYAYECTINVCIYTCMCM